MAEPIAFLQNFAPEQRSAYLGALRAAMPAELVLPYDEIDHSQRAAVRIGIAATTSRAELAELPNLLLLHTLWAGIDRLVAELGDKSPAVVRLVNPEQARRMGEAVLAWCLYLQRDMPAYAAQQAGKVWRQLPYRPPSSVAVGVLGSGVMGAAAIARLREAGFPVTGWSRTRQLLPGVETLAGADGLDQLLSAADIVVCLLPLTPETAGLLNAGRLTTMKRGAALINFSRGEIVDEDALLAALDSGHIGHAVFDVFAREPLPTASPLWMHPSVTVLPHISAPTDAASTAAIIAANISQFRRDGTLPRTVDVGRGY